MIQQTPIWTPSHSTDLGLAFDRHQAVTGRQRKFAVRKASGDWLNALRDRALRTQDASLLSATDQMLGLLAGASGNPNFVRDFDGLFKQTQRAAYPFCCAILDEFAFQSGTSQDYTLSLFDLGKLRAIEDGASNDQSLHGFLQEMRALLAKTAVLPRRQVYSSLFTIYSEALILSSLKDRIGSRLKITKIPETSNPGPDFECELVVERQGLPHLLKFFIEVKTLDILHAPQRLPEILDEAMQSEIEIEKQLSEGKRIGITSREVAPHRPFAKSSEYDPASVRAVIDNISQKAAQNFKNTQFNSGVTFALLNLLRLPLPDQGVGTLAPSFYDETMGGACVSGALWHIAFGQVGAPIHRLPEFEGKGTSDGSLKREGLLVNQVVGLNTPGLIALHYDRGYQFDGFYDPTWATGAWSDVETEEVFYVLCGDYNDVRNGRAHDYSMFRERDPRI